MKKKNKKEQLKWWVEDILIFVIIMLVMIIAGDCEDYEMFVNSKIIAVCVMIPIGLIFNKYGRLRDE